VLDHLVLAGVLLVQALWSMVLFGDKFAHRILGRPSLEARVNALEKQVGHASDRLSEGMSKITTQIIDMQAHLAALTGRFDHGDTQRDDLRQQMQETRQRIDQLIRWRDRGRT
jgi:uncharacterized coiled-coil protein SlyX